MAQPSARQYTEARDLRDVLSGLARCRHLLQRVLDQQLYMVNHLIDVIEELASFGLQRRQSAQALSNTILGLYELCTAQDQLCELALLGARRNVGVELPVFTSNVTRNDLGVDPIGLAAPANRLTIATKISCVDDKYLQTGLMRQIGERLVIAAGRFHGQAAPLRHRAQPGADG